jgi:hypothetical protein
MLIGVKLPGKRTGQERYDELVSMLASRENTEKAISFQKGGAAKPAEPKKAEDVSNQEGSIVQDPASAAYHYKKVGDKHYIISSPKDKKVTAKNATFVDPNSMKGAFDAISKLFN